ncbi:MAG: hypothetical protein OWV35_05445 [Firmicutes bacterium]|nr:hypothetical protein [Bacillota bacterium]
MYATKPEGRLLGEFPIRRILAGPPEAIWAATAAGAGLDGAEFAAYFRSAPIAYAIEVGTVQAYDPPADPRTVLTDFVAPQSFQYLDAWPPAVSS